MKNKRIKFELLLIIILFNSCWMDSNPKILNIKNESERNIVALAIPYSKYKDNSLYNFYGTKILPNLSYDYCGAVTKEFFLYIFDFDSLNFCVQAKQIVGIVKRSFLYKRKLSIDSVKTSDTLIFKSVDSVEYLRAGVHP